MARRLIGKGKAMNLRSAVWAGVLVSSLSASSCNRGTPSGNNPSSQAQSTAETAPQPNPARTADEEKSASAARPDAQGQGTISDRPSAKIAPSSAAAGARIEAMAGGGNGDSTAFAVGGGAGVAGSAATSKHRLAIARESVPQIKLAHPLRLALKSEPTISAISPN